MATCKDCIHYEVCKTEKGSTVFYREGLLSSTYDQVDKICGALFKSRSRFVELPYAVGTTFFWIFNSKVLEIQVHSFYYYDGYVYMLAMDKDNKYMHKFPACEVGKTVFLTKEEAEQAVKERERK